jgi:hypothetical protein
MTGYRKPRSIRVTSSGSAIWIRETMTACWAGVSVSWQGRRCPVLGLNHRIHRLPAFARRCSRTRDRPTSRLMHRVGRLDCSHRATRRDLPSNDSMDEGRRCCPSNGLTILKRQQDSKIKLIPAGQPLQARLLIICESLAETVAAQSTQS